MRNLDKLNPELEYLRKRCLIILRYFYEKYGQLEIYQNAMAAMEIEFKNDNLKVLRHTSKDMSSWLSEMPVKDSLELASILKRELGEDISMIEKKCLDAINKVLRKGRISNLEEYELLASRVDEIYADTSMSDQVFLLNRLLNEYKK